MISTWKQAVQLCLGQITCRRRVGRLTAVLALSLVAIVSLASCGKGSSSTVKSVTITPSSATVNVNQQVTFTAVVTLTDSTVSTTTTVTWEINGSTSDTGCGSIASSPNDQLEGIYTAPVAVPSGSCGITGGSLGQVAVTAVATQTSSSSSSSSSGTVTSNMAVVTVGVVLGLSVSPVSAAVPAGGSQQFSAILNGLAGGASWTLTPAPSAAVNPGTIDSNGLYTAPPFPPPGNSVTVTATVTGSNGSPVNATATATATVTISFSDHSLSGPYAFSYMGDDGSGLFAVAGSFVADGNGNIVSGVEDIQSFLSGISKEVPIMPSSYSVGSDGRGSASIRTNRGMATWRFALDTNLHAALTRFDTDVTGGGSIDQQTLNATTNSAASVVSGRYAFSLLGLDASSNPLGIAGEFSANGSGSIPNTNAILDLNDSGTTIRGDRTLNGSYAFDVANPGTGRGTLTLQSAATGPRTFTFYAVGTPSNCANPTSLCQFYLIETDGAAFTAGEMYLAASNPGLAAATYVFATGGNSSAGASAEGGVFLSDGVSATSNGMLDVNNAGSYNQGASLGSCSFSVDSNTGRVDLGLYPQSGACSSISGPRVSEFAAYPTALGSVVLLELDSSAVSAGLAYQQCGPQSTGCAASSPSLSASSVDLGLIGQGLFHSPPASSASFQPDLDGRLTVGSTTVSQGNLDISNFTSTFPTDPIGTSGTSIGTAANGRGTLTLAATNPSDTYNFVYYLIDDHTALLLSSGQTPVAIGRVARQF